ncbi:MAG: segregation/condensation protein A [Verrucomicrobiae bacterium]|nr:segregation/condensation protein A [Verrucomicrobiae bacterium]
MPDYKVQLEVFEGPLDLLLYLIKKNEVDIYHIPIAKITSQYLEYLTMMKLVVPDVAGEFVVMGATLMYIKSRMLLPADQQQVDPEEPADEMDPRWELIRQLVEYKKFKDAAATLQQREFMKEGMFSRQEREKGASFMPDSGSMMLGELSVFDLLNAFNQVLKRVSEPEDVREISEERFTVSDKIDFIRKAMSVENRTPFTQLFDGAASRFEIIVTFLAMLELIRLKHLRVEQEGPFGEIMVIRQSLETESKTSTPPANAASKSDHATPETAPAPSEPVLQTAAAAADPQPAPDIQPAAPGQPADPLPSNPA